MRVEYFLGCQYMHYDFYILASLMRCIIEIERYNKGVYLLVI
jgi:hypothetical protein